MTPGITDLTAVALPVLPAGHRWVIDRNYIDGWSERRHLGIHLQEQITGLFGKIKWRNIETQKLEPAWRGVGKGTETLVECAEREAQAMYKRQVARLERLLAEESIIGVYESGKDKALP